MKKQSWNFTLLTVVFGLIIASSRQAQPNASAHGLLETGTIRVSPINPDKALHSQSVMVSVIKDGAIVDQREVEFGVSPNFTDLAPGMYDVRFEGEGMVTLMKRGVRVIGDKTNQLNASMQSGKGARVVEFAIGGLPREEVAERLMKLETQVAELQKALKAK